MMARALSMSCNLAKAWICASRAAGDRVVLAHGSFDPLSLGDVEYLKGAARHGQRLAVLVQAETWPLAKERADLVAALRDVDVVVPSGVGVVGLPQVLVDLQPTVFVTRRGAVDNLHDFAGFVTARGIELAVADVEPAQGEQR